MLLGGSSKAFGAPKALKWLFSRPRDPSCRLAQLALQLFLLCGMAPTERLQALQAVNEVVKHGK